MDLMIVMGTSLSTEPFCDTVLQGPQDIPRVLINPENTDVIGFDFDHIVHHPERLFLKGTTD